MTNKMATDLDRLVPLGMAAEATSIPLPTWRAWASKRQTPIPIVRVGTLLRVRMSDIARLIAGEITTPPKKRRGRPRKADVVARERAEAAAQGE